MTKLPFPEPTEHRESRTEVFVGYLDYFRSALVDKLRGLPEDELRSSRLPSGWSPITLLKHLTHVERRWLVWRIGGEHIERPWRERSAGRWYVADDESLPELVAELHEQAARSNEIIRAHELSDLGVPGESWDGEQPASLERVLFHLLQEYARHLGHLDVVRELIDGEVGE
ncbi:DinB family protein [Actinopolyspora erythraea]|uniref:DinB family protein n=1 Tax=Actinopolyspora erythraea TaxID=414996 RepID=A0A099D4E4_9ACTN|nr:DinB family protein [Actinopolyspora erythraea]ASU77302.1 DinB family protein [Actinopolyspora erythraea]KGI80210.1 hypothetical protein IL38_18885 [Actinopolyspora erythraea]